MTPPATRPVSTSWPARRSSAGGSETIVSGGGGAGQGARHRAASRPRQPEVASRVSLREMQFQRADAGGGIEPDLALDRQRLQRHRTVRAADQRIGADAGDRGRLRGRADIGAGSMPA